jgi:hypothetical protein
VCLFQQIIQNDMREGRESEREDAYKDGKSKDGNEGTASKGLETV